jgi:hypothetical protein
MLSLCRRRNRYFEQGTELDEGVASPLIVATNHATGVRELSIRMEKLIRHGRA